MTTKHSPGKVTLAMIKGKPITTSVPVIHYHASDDELEEIYPSTDEEKRLTPEFEKILSKTTYSPQKCTEKKSAQESCVSENNSNYQSVIAENLIPEGTPPSSGAWKMLSEIKGKITKTFEEKLSEIKSDKKKPSRAEGSSISDSEDQGSITPCNDTMNADKEINESSTPVVLPRNNPVKYVGFSGIKTGLKDKSLQEESVESGIEASEFSPDIGDDPAPHAETNASFTKSSDSDSCIKSLKQVSHSRSTSFSTQPNLNFIFSYMVKQLTYQITYTSVAVLIAILCIYYVTPLPEYLIGLLTGVVTTIMFHKMTAKFKTILTSIPNEKFVNRQIIPVLEIPAVEEHAVIEKFQGWINELPYRYEPTNYHVARTKSVFLRLEGSILRIMETRMKVPKKAVWDESQHKLKFFKKRIYNLTGAKIELLPCGLARRRRWSKKYPICITLKKRALICNVILKDSAYDECYSTVNDHEQAMSESNTKGTATSTEAKNGDETSHAYTKERGSITGQTTERRGEEEEEDGGDREKSLLEKEEDTVEYDDDDDGIENFNSDFDNDEIDNEYRIGELQTLEDGNLEELCRKRKRKKKDKDCTEEKMNNDELKKNAKKYHVYGFDYIDRKKTIMIDNHDDNNYNHDRNYNDDDDGINDDDDVYYVSDYIVDDDDDDHYEDEDEEEVRDDDDDDDDCDDDDNYNDVDDDDNDNDDYDDYNKDSDEYDEKEDQDDENRIIEDKKKMRQTKKYEVEKVTEVEKLRKRKWKRRKRKNREREKEKDVEIEDEDLEDEARQTKGKEIEKEEKEMWENVGMFQTASPKKKSVKKRKNKHRLRNEMKIFIFARADREKEDWYRRLVSASVRRTKKADASFAISDTSSTSNMLSTQRTGTTETKSTNNSFESEPDLSYHTYMAKYFDINCSTSETEHFSHIDNTLWINCLVARILFDVHKCPETVNLIRDKIQRKLSSIKLPYFMECLLVSEIAIGQGAPIIRNVTKPVTNERGLWIDLDITYKGALTMTVETKLNLMKLTKTGNITNTSGAMESGSGGGDVTVYTGKEETITKSPIFNSDMEDTPETSTEDDDSTQFCSPAKEINPPTQSSGRKFLNIVDRIAANKYFQHATELSYVRRAMEGVSNTEIRLMVTISSIDGCLSLNIPPAPSDRLWYGFKPVPKVSLTVKPAVGERAVNIVYVTKWIEDKLLREFEKLVVLPNMDDFVLPLCPNYPYSNKR